ncbi:hypothetical protein BTO01_05280 [Vibrio jasicida]|uniref:DUF2845 domain-containing protein n=1 Tax=Vibrio jasicida TaxID=766224 RepID=UPI000CF54CD6|nr:DUF2845 domain-containing protein [Vibrio jasicida]PQJ70719.1 hypothetical protein BTO01_05280 [Vibrio jasicida]
MDILISLIIFSIIFRILQNIQTLYDESKLINKYGDKEVVDKIMKRLIWKGQTEEQLIDSVGRPTYLIHEHHISGVKEVWRYEHSRKKYGRYRDFGKQPLTSKYLLKTVK